MQPLKLILKICGWMVILRIRYFVGRAFSDIGINSELISYSEKSV